MIEFIKPRYAFAVALVAVLAIIPTTLPAQTVEVSAVKETTAPTHTVADVEMERRLNELRSEYLDHRADSITWGLTVVTILFAVLGLVTAIVGFMGFQRFRHIENEARKHAAEAGKCAEETKTHKAQAEKDAMATQSIREATSEDAANPAKAEQVEKAVETVRQAPDASLIDKAIAMAYSFQKAGEIEKAIAKWRSIAYFTEEVDNKIGELYTIIYKITAVSSGISAPIQPLQASCSHTSHASLQASIKPS